MKEFLTGPMLWVTFSVLIVGCIYHIIWYFRGLNALMDRVAYGEDTGRGIKWGLKSIFFWLIPFGSRSWREKPIFTILFFAFHIGIVAVPLFLEAHAVILKDRFGISWPTMNGTLADVLTIAMILAGVLIIVRRIVLPEVRILTKAKHYALILITVAPFLTGLMCRLDVPGYEGWLLAHLITAHIMLLAIPFTKLNHMVLFFCSRFQLGMDYGIKRGGQKGRGIAW